MERIYGLLGNSSIPALRIKALWEEYEARETPESKFVKDLDLYELCQQAVEYENCTFLFRSDCSFLSETDSIRRAPRSARMRFAAGVLRDDYPPDPLSRRQAMGRRTVRVLDPFLAKRIPTFSTCRMEERRTKWAERGWANFEPVWPSPEPTENGAAPAKATIPQRVYGSHEGDEE